MADTLRTAGKKRRPRRSTSTTSTTSSAAKKIADKLASGTKEIASKTSSAIQNTYTKVTTPTNHTTPVNPGTPIKSDIAGLTEIAPDALASMMPTFDSGKYSITDPLKPDEKLPQVNESDFNKSTTIYQGTQRALKLTGMAFDTVTERFNVVGKQARAFGSGIKAATEFQKTKGLYLDYQSQLETNSQKETSLTTAKHITTNESTRALSLQKVSDEKKAQAGLDAQLAEANTTNKQNQLTELQKQLGQYLPASK